ncbi:MAG: thiamine pyrophosphate-binding protein, partial [Dehalococcoidales bacterium]|nr:thiamine pyrophosphate-binding protein [Dehalococcoidales bacterium]
MAQSDVDTLGERPKTASDTLVEALTEWGVDTIFGIPGDGVDGVIEALRRARDKIRFIHVRHEEGAAFAACAYAKFTGKLGVCVATSGPGGIHLLNGLYDAMMDGQPVLAITGMQYHDVLNTFTQQDVELDKLFSNVSLYDARIMGPAHVCNTVDLACRTALSGRGVAHITIPIDFQEATGGGERSQRNVPGHTSQAFAGLAPLPDESQIRRAADILNAGKKVVILAGRGALDATAELEELADKLAGPIIKPLLGKACVPDNSPFTTGGLGLVGTKPSQTAMEECDTLFMIGTSFPYIEFLPKPGQARGVQLDIDPQRIGLRYPVELGLVGDSRRTLQALLPMLDRKSDRGFLEKAQKRTKDWWQLMEQRGTNSAKPLKPQVVAWEIGKRLRDDAIVISDSGTIATWVARQIPIRRGQMFSLSGMLATMANGLPYAVGAQIAHPHRQVVAYVGDGGFSMLMAEFSTAVKYHLPIKIVIAKNNILGQIRWEQMVFQGRPEYGIELEPIDFAAFARACGGTGFTVDDPADCGAVIEKALNTEGPVIVEAVVDPFEPPLPANITLDQATKFAQALARGEPNRERIVLTVLS